MLLLDKDDITFCCGSMTSDELCKELKMNNRELVSYLDKEVLYHKKYVLIEDG